MVCRKEVAIFRAIVATLRPAAVGRACKYVGSTVREQRRQRMYYIYRMFRRRHLDPYSLTNLVDYIITTTHVSL